MMEIKNYYKVNMSMVVFSKYLLNQIDNRKAKLGLSEMGSC